MELNGARHSATWFVYASLIAFSQVLLRATLSTDVFKLERAARNRTCENLHADSRLSYFIAVAQYRTRSNQSSSTNTVYNAIDRTIYARQETCYYNH